MAGGKIEKMNNEKMKKRKNGFFKKKKKEETCRKMNKNSKTRNVKSLSISKNKGLLLLFVFFQRNPRRFP